jgi:hypothetical protein
VRILAGIVAALLLLLGLQTYRLSEAQLVFTTYKLTQEKKYVEDLETSRIKYQTLTEKYEVLNEENSKRQQELASLYSAGESVAQRVRKQYSQALNKCATPNSSVRPGSTSTPSTRDMLADVYRRIDEAASTVGKVADERGNAVVNCTSKYDKARESLR